jgi:Zn finger protein HypA/HybF involved in hydrogenase expression
MPTIDHKVNCTCPECDTEFEESTGVDFSVYCGECGAGICSSSDYDKRSESLTVTCPHCHKAYKDVIKDLESDVSRLEDIEYNLRNEIETLKQEIKKYQ